MNIDPPRFPNTDRLGNSFNSLIVIAVWCKAAQVPGQDPNVWRKDRCGVWIKFADYGKETAFGWHIDHDLPVSEGGGDELSNLQPLHWRNNLGKADLLVWSCALTAP